MVGGGKQSNGLLVDLPGKSRTYNMVCRGVALNGASFGVSEESIRVRTNFFTVPISGGTADGHGTLSPITGEQWGHLERVAPVRLDLETRAVFEKSTEALYSQFNQDIKVRDEWVPLYHLRRGDTFRGFVGEVPEGTQITYSERYGYLVKVSSPCSLSFVMSTAELTSIHSTAEAFDKLDLPDDVKAVLAKQANLEGVSCLKRCFDAYQNLKLSIDAERLNVIGIDQNHVRLEIKIGTVWHTLDLGGRVSKFLYDETSIIPFEPASSVKTSKKNYTEYLAVDDLDKMLKRSGHALLYSPTPEPLVFYLGRKLMDERTSHYQIKDLDEIRHIDAKAVQIRLVDAASGGVTSSSVQVSTGESSLKSFLEEPKDNRYLLINWADFEGAQGSINSLLDPIPHLHGKEFPGLKVVVVMPSSFALNDDSFSSRFNHHYRMTERLAPSLPEAVGEVSILDMAGMLDFQSRLFGPFSVTEGEVSWDYGSGCLSPHINTDGPTWKVKTGCYQLTHIPREKLEAVERFVAEANVRRVLVYHGMRIELATGCYFSCNDGPLTLPSPSVDHSYHKVIREFQPPTADPNCILVNAHNFDRLLIVKTLTPTEDGKSYYYSERKGVLLTHERDTLSLFVTSRLSLNQWYVLFQNTRTKKLRLYLTEAAITSLPSSHINALCSDITAGGGGGAAMHTPAPLGVAKSEIIITESARGYTELNESERLTPGLEENRLVIDVDDLSYWDLLYQIEPNSVEGVGVKFNASLIQSDLLRWLADESKTLVLRGCFSDQLLAGLEQLIYSRKIQLPNQVQFEVKANIKLIIEVPSPRTCKILSWCTNRTVDTEKYSQHQKFMSGVLADTGGAARDVSDGTIDLKATIDNCKVTVLKGPPGTGKTNRVRELAEAGEITMHLGVDAISRWANDKSGRQKVLYLNLAEMPAIALCYLAPLLSGTDKPRIYWQNKIRVLSETHRVVIAIIPDEFGANGLSFPTLLNRYKDVIAEVAHLAPDKDKARGILIPLFSHLGIEEPKDVARLMAKYSPKNGFRPIEQAALELSVQATVPTRWLGRIPMSSYIPTDSYTSVLNEVGYFIAAQKLSKEKSSVNLGFNGLYLEGPPGIGKSALLQHVLLAQGYVKGRDFIEISAGASLEKKQTLLTIAYAVGQIVIIDELNTCLSDRFSSYLNSLLSGNMFQLAYITRPEGCISPGFMMLATGNSAALSGRKLFRPSTLARMKRLKMSKTITIEDLTKVAKDSFSGKTTPLNLDILVKHVIKTHGGISNITLRSFLTRLNNEISPPASKLAVTCYHASSGASSATGAAAVKGLHSRQSRLETVDYPDYLISGLDWI